MSNTFKVQNGLSIGGVDIIDATGHWIGPPIEGTGGGSPGPQGPQGFQGSSGTPGLPGIGVQGSQGYQGYQGPSGGAQGPQGFQGRQGSQGNQGNVGINGTNGVQGAQGSTGPQGVPGGSQGYQGFQGNQGFQGTQGNQGFQSSVAGPQGYQGFQGPQGYQGFQGNQGFQSSIAGPQGYQGPQGFQGNQGFQSSVAGPQGYQGDQGFQGNQGYQGNQGFQGNQGYQGPQGFQGNQGFQSSVAGPQGYQGDQGFQGNQGYQGNQGFQGNQGYQGPQGFQGNQGFQSSVAGPQGYQGDQGVQGSQGYQGNQGFQGNQGYQGPQGFQGNQGAQGTTGAQGSAAATTNYILSSDTRNTNYLPSDRSAGLYADFRDNTVDGLGDGGSYHGILTFRSYGSSTDLSGGYPIQISYTANGNLYTRMGTGASTWGSWTGPLVRYGQNPSNNGSLYGTVFYDSDNTGYYVDPDNGGFNLKGGTSNRVTYSTNDSGFKVYNAEGTGVSDVRLGAAWGAPGVYSSSYLMLGSENYIEFRTQNSQRGYIDNSANLLAFGSMRSPIFYDYNDTSYYVDPNASTSASFNGNVYINPQSANWAEGIQFYMPTTSTWGGIRWVRNRSNYYGSWYLGWTALDSSNDLVFGTNASGTQTDNVLRLYNASSGSARIGRDLYLYGLTGGNYGNRLIVGNTDTSYTLQDTNVRPTIQVHGQYPVLSLNHTVTSNGNHGPTIQMTCNGTGNQFVIGTGGTGYHLTMGYSSAGDWNPHNGISGYNGTSYFIANTDGNVGIGAQGDWGGLGGGQPGYAIDTRGTLYNNTDIRAPIFYDSNDTNYYCDPNSNSRFNNIYNSYVRSYGDIRADSYVYAAGRVVVGEGAASSWLEMRDTDEGTRYLHNNSGTIGFVANDGNWSVRISDDGNIWTRLWSDWLTNQWRTAILYDYNNTGYYVDPASTASASFAGYMGLGGNSYASSMAGTYGVSIYHVNYPSIGWQNQYGYNWLLYKQSTRLTLWNSTDGDWVNFYAGPYLQVSPGSIRAPIFYDSDNTGYYWDGSSTSKWNESNQDGWHTFNNYGTGITGTYDSYRLQTVFAMGSAYRMQYDGNATLNMYGIAWSHPNAGSLGGANNLNDHGILIINNGTFRAAISSRAVFSADVRGTLFYDYNNTGYYCDPNSNSNFAGNLTAGEIYANYWFRNYGLQGMYNETYPNHWYADSTAYWSLAGTNNSYCGIRFRPEGHQSTVRGYVYADTSNNIGFLGSDGNWKLRVVSNDYSLADGSSMRAQLYYDSNNTGYYCDPNSTSNLYAVVSYSYQGNGNVGGTGSASWHPSGIYSAGYNWLYGGINAGGSSVTNMGDARANIFYDYNNTGYACDPASTSNLNQINLQGIIRRNIIQAGYLEGNYPSSVDSNSSSCIYTIGGSYQPGTTNLGNMYGIGYTYGAGTAAPGLGLGGWGLYVASNGTSRHFFDSDNGVSISSDSKRAPIFYDSANTAYYCDPNAGSYLYSLVLSGAGYFRPQNWIQFDSSYGIYWPNHYGAHLKANDNSTYTQISILGSKNSYGGIYDYYSGVNGIMYDGGGNGGIYREGNSRWYIYYHLGNDCLGIGTSTTSSTYGVYCSKGAYFGSRVDGTIFYDSNDTGYYCDPNGSSQLQGHTRFGPYAGSTSSGNVTGVEIMNNGSTGDSNVAAISFHCSGTYGLHMHLRNDGYFGIGGWSASTWRWYVNNTNGDMTAAGNVTAYSDPRLKEDIAIIDSPLKRLSKLDGVRFKWREDMGDVIGNPGKYDYGVIATQVEEVFPELVSESAHESQDGDRYKTVAYDKLVPVLIEAIKEQQKQIDELKALVNNKK